MLRSTFTKKLRTLSATFILSCCVATLPSISNAQEMNKEAVEKIIRSYLLENPEIMIEVQTALEKKQEVLRVSQQAETLESMKEQIYNSPNQMTIGDPNAKITLVEFFDYNCGFCKRAMDDMDQIVSENPDVKFIMKEFPVLGEASLQASQVSLAIINTYPELYDKFHRQLLGATGGKDGTRAMQVATELGADEDKIRAAIDDPNISSAIQEVYSIADGLGITGTPSYVVGGEVVFGAVGHNRLMPMIENIRKCGKSTCS